MSDEIVDTSMSSLRFLHNGEYNNRSLYSLEECRSGSSKAMSARSADTEADAPQAIVRREICWVNIFNFKATPIQPADTDTDAPRAIVRRETCWVTIFKILLVSVLSIAAITMSVSTYFTVKQGETKNFETQFRDFSEFMVENFYQSTNIKMWTANLITVAISTHAKQSGEVIPNATMDDWKIATAGARRLADSSVITYSPILNTREELSQWEAFAVEIDRTPPGSGPPPGGAEGEGWTGTRRLRHLQGDISDEDVFARDDVEGGEGSGRTIADGIYSYQGDRMVDYEGPGPYAPIWHVSPECNNSASTMYNQMAEEGRRDAIENVLRTEKPSYSRILYKQEEHEAPHVRHETPRSILFYPVLSDYISFRIVGLVGVEFSWEDYFGLVPIRFNGIVLVLETTGDQIFTFKVDGGKAKFMGEGDLHDSQYDDMEVQSTFKDFDGLGHNGAEFWINTYQYGRRLQEEEGVIDVRNHTIHYQIRVYPSEEFKANYISDDPKVYAITVAMIFCFTSMLFVLYDCFVQRRQDLTMQSAERSSAVVNSLFPAVVRERLLETGDGNTSEHKKLTNTKGSEVFPNNHEPLKRKLRTFLTEDSTEKDDSEMSRSPPIADLFPHTTVMFADISGFTAWSSEREPTQVFVLLETLYREFDALARKLGVFKVETIGDCYVAVTGLPEPSKDHAIVLARFAWKCVLTTISVCKRLEATLGPGTADLALRVGLHSGPVTAGVLRGEKSRFQLFGDTMNTASRVESNGMKNRVQVSQSTADLLISGGKQHWLTPRENKIDAKGKGAMQTYWLRLPRKRSSATSSSTGISSHSVGGRHSSMDLNAVSSNNSDCLVSSIPEGPTASAGGGSFRRQTTRSWGDATIKDTKMKLNANEENLIDWNVEVLVPSLQKPHRLECGGTCAEPSKTGGNGAGSGRDSQKSSSQLHWPCSSS